MVFGMTAVLVRLVLFAGCMTGVLSTHKAATLFSESAAIMEQAASVYPTTVKEKRKLKTRAVMWRALYLLMVALMVAFAFTAAVSFLLFEHSFIMEVFR